MTHGNKTGDSNPWRKFAIIPGTTTGCFELNPGQNCKNERFHDFDVWIGLEGQAVVHMLGHEIELQKDRMILIPPGITIRLCGKADQRLRKIYSHFDCIVAGRSVRNTHSLVNETNLTLTLDGLPTVALVAEIDSESVSRKLMEARKSFTTDLAEMTLSLLYLEIWRRLRKKFLSPQDTLSAQRLEKTINYFESRLEQRISLEQTARYVSVSPETLARLFRNYYKVTPMRFLSRMRLIRARDLLCSRQYQIGEIGYKVGFNSPQYFSRTFKREYGISPTDFTRKRPSC